MFRPFDSHLSISYSNTNIQYSPVIGLVQYENLRPQHTWTPRATRTIYQTAKPLKGAFAWWRERLLAYLWSHSVSPRLPLDGFPWNLVLKNRRENPFFNWAKVSVTLHEGLLCVTGAGDIKSPQKRSLRMKWYQAVDTAGGIYTLNKTATCIAYLVETDYDQSLFNSWLVRKS